jgi:drug/metabolite transporter (DMT)-like permease
MVLAAGTLVANDSCMKIVMADAPPLQVLFMRGVAASLWCLPLVLILGYGRKIPLVFNPWILLRCLCEVVAVTCFILALKQMPLGDITAIYQTAPLIVLAGAWLIWGERIGGMRMGLIGAGILGALLVAQPGATAASPYAAFGFATAIGSAARDLVSRKVPHSAPGLVVSFATVLTVMLTSAIATAGFEIWVPPTINHLLLMALAGLLLMFGHFFIFLAFRLASPRTVAPFYYSFTVWAVGLGFAIFDEVPNGLAIAGILLIVGAGLTVMLLDSRKRGTLPARAGVTIE